MLAVLRVVGIVVAVMCCAVGVAWAQGVATPKPETPVVPRASADRAERYYSVELMGAKSGWMRSRTETVAGTITTSSTMLLRIARGEQAVEIRMSGEFVESEDGTPVSMSSEQAFAAQTTRATTTFGEGEMVTVTRQAGKDLRSTAPLPEGEWMTPARAERVAKERFLAGERTITTRSMDPMAGASVLESTRTVGERETLTIDGERVEATKVTTSVSMMPGVASTEWLDADGELVRSETSIGGMRVVMTRASREDALDMPKGRDAGKLPEVMVGTFVTPDKPVNDARSVTRATFRLLPVRAGQDVAPVPTSGAQSAESEAGGKGVLVRVSMLPETGEALSDAARAAALAATPLADASDEAIVAFKNKVLSRAKATTDYARAEALRVGVHGRISAKNLGVGFASASEVARTGEGDCTEHGVLLVAALRAAGIPARGVMGLIYADQFAGSEHIFGYHMWAQAHVSPPEGGEARWIDFDATLPAGTRFDATHIALTHTDLGDQDGLRSMVGVAAFMGAVRIEVVEVASE